MHLALRLRYNMSVRVSGTAVVHFSADDHPLQRGTGGANAGLIFKRL
jgi:hypothetical protein